MGVKKSTVSTAASDSLICQTAASSLVSYPSNKRSSTGRVPAVLNEESMLLRSPGPHLAAQPPFEVSLVRRMRSNSDTPTSFSSAREYTSQKPRLLIDVFLLEKDLLKKE